MLQWLAGQFTCYLRSLGINLTIIFSLQQLNLTYPAEQRAPAKPVLQDITLTIKQRDKVAILGPNGAGKSSLLSVLSGCPPVTSGQLDFNQQPINSLAHSHLAREIAFLPQHNPPLPGLTCYQVAAMGLLPHKSWFERDNQQDLVTVTSALQQTGLLAKQQHRVETLSGGEWQRLTLARALVQQAGVLLLDEPTNHLDIQYQHQFMRLLQQLDKTVVCALHDVNLAARYCTKIILLDDGKLVAYGTPAEVLQVGQLSAVFGMQADVTRHPQQGWLYVQFLQPEGAC